MALDNSEMLEYTKNVKAGYFYVFGYNAKTKEESDSNPVIYCAYAYPMDNFFVGINFHYFNDSIKVYILQNMQKNKNILDDDIPHIFNGEELYNTFSDIKYGLREYNKSRVNGCYRIKNKYVPEFLKLPSRFFMTTDSEQEALRELQKNTNKGY